MKELDKYKSKTCPGTEHFNLKMMNQLAHEVTIQEAPVAATSTTEQRALRLFFPCSFLNFFLMFPRVLTFFLFFHQKNIQLGNVLLDNSFGLMFRSIPRESWAV